MEFPQKIKLKNTTKDLAIPLLDIYSKITKTLIGKDIHSLMFIVALFKIAKIWKLLKFLLIDE